MERYRPNINKIAWSDRNRLVPPTEESPSADPWRIAEAAGRYGKDQDGCYIYYIRRPFTKEPDFGVTSVNYDLSELLGKASSPC